MATRPITTSLLLSGLGPVTSCVDLAVRAHEAGLDRVWLTERNGPDALVAASAIAAAAPIEVGTALLPITSRSPVTMATAAADLTHLSGRPVHLGIGVGGQVLVERWHGESLPSVDRVAETVSVLRQTLSGERTDHGGRVRSRGYALANPPTQPVSVLIGAMGPRLTRLAGEVADGLLLSWCTIEEVGRRRAALDVAAEAAGRDPRQIRLVARLYAAVGSDPSSVHAAVRAELAEYLASPPYARAFTAMGFEDDARRAAEAFTRGDRKASALAAGPAMVDAMVVCGDGSAMAERIAALLETGADEVMVQPVPSQHGGQPEVTIDALAALR